ncbi:MAG TPA: hypothetical protein VK177_08270 [Flavobacteriales bacterium]|nr:hypothetical protein [Flavobacteriales bacterium]
MRKWFILLLTFLICKISICQVGNCVNVAQPPLPMVGFSTQWKLRKIGDEKWIDSVMFPASIHEILFKKKLISDPYFGDNEKNLKWIEESDWEAICTMDTVGLNLPVQQLIVNGLSPFARVYLNEQFIFESKNEFIEYKKDIAPYLNRNKPNTLRIVFESPVKRAKALMAENKLVLPGEERVYVRKPQFEFGWDWGPRFVLTGISKWCFCASAKKKSIEFTDAFITTTNVSKEQADLACSMEIYSTIETEKYLNIAANNVNLYKEKVLLKKGINKFNIPVKIPYPQLWWPRGMGYAHTYSIGFSLEARKKPKRRDVGTSVGWGINTYAICKIKLVNDATNGFYIEVNGKPLYAKGFNLIPGEHIARSIPANLYTSLVQDYIGMSNANMIRVWGGGDYASYDLLYWCQQNGILVWQDFMFACAMYPGDTSFVHNVKEEVSQQVKRLRNYNNVALWCGNNENDEGWKNWGWQKQYAYSKADSAQIWNDYKKIFHEIIPGIVQQYDPGRAYIPSSPEIGWGHKESMQKGDSHYWGVWWGKEPIETFEKKIPRFMSEFGMQAMPDLSTLRKVIPDSLMNFDSPEFKNHQKHPTGFETLNHYLNEYLIVPHTVEDYAYATQVLQAMTLKTAIETQRTARPYCMGTLLWQLNDSWPVTSWSIIDHSFQPKIGYEQVKESFATKIITIKEDSLSYDFYVVNDDTASISDTLAWSICYFNGQKALEGTQVFKAQASSSTKLFSLAKKSLSSLNKKEIYAFALLRQARCRQVYNFEKPNALNLPKADFSIDIHDSTYVANESNEKYTIRFATITANTYMPWTRFMDNYNQDKCLLKRMHYDFPTQFLPGDSYTLILNCDGLETPKKAESYIRKNLKCLNSLLNKN